MTTLSDLSQLSLLAWLERNNIPRDGVKFVELTFGEVGVALTKNVIQAAIIIEPFRSAAIAAGQIHDIGDTLLAMAPEISPMAWFTTRTWLKNNRDLAKRLVKAIYATAAFTNNHPKETGDTLARITKTEPAVMASFEAAHLRNEQRTQIHRADPLVRRRIQNDRSACHVRGVQSTDLTVVATSDLKSLRRTRREPAPEHLSDGRRIERFWKMIVHPGVEALAAIVFHRMGGHRDIGKCAASIVRRMMRVASKPSMSGICTSMSTASKWAPGASTFSTASRPLSAGSIVIP